METKANSISSNNIINFITYPNSLSGGYLLCWNLYVDRSSFIMVEICSPFGN